MAAHGGRFIVRAWRSELMVGDLPVRHVVVEFPSYEAALACYQSPEYAEARAVRQANARGSFVVIAGAD